MRYLAAATVLLLFVSAFQVLPERDEVPEGDVIFEEDFSGVPLGQVPESFEIAGGSGSSQQEHPLLEAFARFHFDMNERFLHRLARTTREKAKGSGDSKFLISGNLGGVVDDEARWPEMATVFDYLNSEFRFGKSSDSHARLLAFLHMTEAIGVPVALMPTAFNNRSWENNPEPRYYASLVAHTYSQGHTMHVPYNLYYPTYKERFYGRFETHREVFRFISEHDELLNGYEEMISTGIAVPYQSSQPTDWLHTSELKNTLLSLSRENVSYRLRFYGDVADSLEKTDIDKFEQVRVIGSSSNYSEEVWQRLQEAKNQQGSAEPLIEVEGEGASSTTAVPRAHLTDPDAPVVLHLLRNPRVVAESKGNKGAVTLVVDRRLFNGNDPQGITVHTSEGAKKKVQPSYEGSKVRIPVGDPGYWSLIEVDAGNQASNSLIRSETHPFRNRPIPQADIPLMRLADDYNKPAWLREALADGVDPIEQYHATRISWAYNNQQREVEKYREQGINYHGAVGLASAKSTDGRDADWPGWARHSDGQPIVYRADFAGPRRYYGSFASEEYLDLMESQTQVWNEVGARGVQWDGVGTPLATILPRMAGDFSEASMKQFANWLRVHYSDSELEEEMGLEEVSPSKLPQQITKVRRQEVVNGGVVSTERGRAFQLSLENPDRKSPTMWLSTPKLASSTQHVRVDMAVRYIGEQGEANTGIYLKDGFGSAFGASANIGDDHLAVYTGGESIQVDEVRPPGEWNEVSVFIDFSDQTTSFAVNDTSFSKPYPFRNDRAAKYDNFLFAFLRRPNSRTIQIADLRIFELPSGVGTVLPRDDGLPKDVQLFPNYPNPATEATTIRYALPQEGKVQLTVYDTLGRRVAQLVNGQKAAGTHRFRFEASDLAAGVYVARLRVDGRVLTRKVTIVK